MLSGVYFLLEFVTLLVMLIVNWEKTILASLGRVRFRNWEGSGREIGKDRYRLGMGPFTGPS